jgi:hypothetical protein
MGIQFDIDAAAMPGIAVSVDRCVPCPRCSNNYTEMRLENSLNMVYK